MHHVLRRLVRMPLFTIIAVATLAVGIGANAAIFSVVQGILLKPLPYPSPEQLISVDHAAAGLGVTHAGAAPFLYFTYRAEARTLQGVGLWRSHTASVTGRGEPEEVPEIDVTSRLLPVLGVPPLLGRAFTDVDDAPDAPATVMLTYGYWRSKFGGDPSIVGQRLIVDGRPRDIIGVMPDRFRFLDSKAALIVPLGLDPDKVFVGNFSYQGIARLKPGATLADANADAARMIPIAMRSYPPAPGFSAKMFEDAKLTAAMRPLKEELVGEIGGVLWVLMGTIALVLLIACANVANLLLVRAEARQQELAIRSALGAGRREIVRELLLESVTLGVIGGICGLAVAGGALRLLVAIAPATLPRLDEIGIDGVVLAFTFAISIAAGLLFGSIPVFKYVGPELAGALRGGGRTASHSRERHRARNTLVVVQVALALVLLVGSGLMIRTFQALKRVQPGFTRPDELQTLRLSIPRSQIADLIDVVRTEQAIAEKIAAIPGVASVGLASYAPMSGNGWQDPVFAEDRVYTESQIPPLRRYRFVAPGLLETAGNTLVAGRDFTWTDLYDKRPVVLISENLARELWRDPAAALGKRLRENLKGRWREIVGVVGDERDDGVDHPAPTTVFWPILMANFEGDEIYSERSLTYLIRSSRAGSTSFLNEIGRAVWSVNPNLPLAAVHTQRELYDRSLARTSFTLVILAIAGVMALVLGIAGVYGVISYAVSQRTREIGIRIALGARNGEVTRMFVGDGLRLAAIGIACGLAAAVALTRLMSSLLFDVRAVDPLTYGAVSLGLVAAAILASAVPALQAAAVDPVDALRAE
jgi:putative ABC transport system permease protein